MLKDPVCGQRIRRNRAFVEVEYQQVTYFLCCPRCQAEFEAHPERYARPELGQATTAKKPRRVADHPHYHG